MRGGPGPTAEAPPPPAAASLAEEVEENSVGEEVEDDELELGLCLASNKKQQQQPASPAPCRILTARDLQLGALSPDSSVSSSSPAAKGTAAASKRAKAPTSPGTVPSGHPHRSAPTY
jgi:auxin-responsive protein IAA